MRPEYEVADVLRGNMGQLSGLVGNSWQLRTLQALSVCRTMSMGGHIDLCTNPACNHLHVSYNSCRNRHCPKCQGHKREEWIQAREKELFKASYYHVVFTLPDALNRLCLFEPAMVYNLLFQTAWQVVKGFAANHKFLGAQTGMMAILHTWGQNLSLHPHLHCIVPGGGLTPSKKWKAAKGKNKYLFPVKAMGKVFRSKFAEGLRKQTRRKEGGLYKKMFTSDWVVYCKQPFWGPAQVVEYLGRYTHKIAISNHRIKSIGNGHVTFTAKDYRKGGDQHLVTLTDREFIRRFSLHILPKGFTRIRHYGILSSTLKESCIELLQAELGKVQLPPNPVKHMVCFKCHNGKLVTVYRFDSRGPPPKGAAIYEIAKGLKINVCLR